MTPSGHFTNHKNKILPYNQILKIDTVPYWKDHAEIHSARRNILKPEKARDLVFVATSLRLQEHAHKIELEKKKAPAAEMADEDLDDFDEEEDEEPV